MSDDTPPTSDDGKPHAKPTTTKRNKDKKRLLTLIAIGFGVPIIICTALVLAIYQNLIKFEVDVNNAYHDLPSLCWQNQGRHCTSNGILATNYTSYRYYNIPLSLKYEGELPIQNREVIMTIPAHAGSISQELAEGLAFITVRFDGAMPYLNDSGQGAVTIGGFGLRIHPTTENDSMAMSLKPMDRGLEGQRTSIMWTSTDSYHPVVELQYMNGTTVTHSFDEVTVNVQSESEFNKSIREEQDGKKNQAEKALDTIILATGSIGAIVVVLIEKRK